MEGRSHSSKSYAVAGEVSRMASDLEKCSEDFVASYKSRPAIRQRAIGNETKRVKVCIVGAGLSGLRCAQVLLEKGVDVAVYEARNRIGGRVCQENLSGRLVDMGPNWVHGTESNPIVRLAAVTKTTITNLGEESVYFGSDGKPVDDERVEKLDELTWEIISEAFAYSNKSCADIPPNLSLKDWFEEQLPKRGLNQEDNALVMQMAQLWGSFIGDSWDRQSLKWFWLEECLDGENLYAVDSHKRIIDRIAQRVLPHVKLNTRVKRIESSMPEQGDPTLKLTIVEGSGDEYTEHFDEVVVAIPMGCLKRGVVDFSPHLPDDIETAISNASISSLEKVYLAFTEAFWDIPSKVSGGVNGKTPSEDSGYLPGFANFLNPTSYGPREHHSWCLELNPLSNPEDFGEHAQPALLFSLFGDCGHELTSRIGGLPPATKGYFDIVNDFLKPYYSRLPHYSPTDPACTPTAVLATDWQNDEHAYGSYTNFKVHSSVREVELDDEVRTMRRGMPERGIWLAGEHVAPFVGLGTSTGAYWSGEMAAMRVLSANGRAERIAKGRQST